MLAFLVAEELRAEGLALTSGKWRLNLLKFGENESIPTDLSFVEPRGLRWSPTGDPLAVAGMIGERGGLWLLDPGSSSKPRLVLEGEIGEFSWSPDGQRLVAIDYAGNPLAGKVMTVSVENFLGS